MDKPTRASKVVYEVSPDQSNLRWRDIGQFLTRYWRTIAVVFATTVIASYATVSLLTEKYDTSASILVKMGRENLDPPPTARNQSIFSSGLRREEVISEIEFLQSRRLIDATVSDIGVQAFLARPEPPADSLGQVKYYVKSLLRGVKGMYREATYGLGLDKRLSDEEAAIAEVSDNLTVVHQKDTDVIALNLRMASPELARSLLDAVIVNYMKERIEVRETDNVNAFLDDESERLRTQLDHAEAELAGWKQSNGLSDTGDQKTALINQINGLTASGDATEREVQAVREELKTTRALLTDLPETVRRSRQEVVNPSLDGLRARLVVLQSENAHLLTQFQPDSPAVRANVSEIERIGTLIEAQSKTHVGSETIEVNPVREELVKSMQAAEIRLAGLETRASMQSGQLNSLRQQLARLEAADLQLSRIERQQRIDEGQYLEMLRRRQEAEVSAKLDLNRISNVAVLSPPTSTFTPVYPRKLLIMGISLILGLGLGIGLSLLLAYMDETVYDEREIEEVLALPHLGTVARKGHTAGS